MLYIFDLDGTLVKSFLEEVPCEVCRGTGKIPDPDRGSGWGPYWDDPCEKCSARGFTLRNVGLYNDPLEWLPNRIETLRAIRVGQAVPRFAIATNQTGVVHGYQTHEQISAKMEEVRSQFFDLVGRPVEIYACRDLTCRKPKPRMLERAMNDFGFKTWETIFVGDMDSDREAARSAGIAYADASDFFKLPGA